MIQLFLLSLGMGKKIPQNTSFFTYYNANPFDKKTGDCVMRALSMTPGYDWYKVYDELCELGRETGHTPTCDETWDAWLKSHNYVRYKQPRHPLNRCLYSLREFVTSDLINDDDTVIVSVSGHLTCVKGRKIYDTWNCAGYKVRRYYKLKR